MIYWCDCDTKGSTSIDDVLATGKAVHLPCPTFNEFKKFGNLLIPRVSADDLVIVDTLSNLLVTTRGDVTFGIGEEELDAWEARRKWMKSKGSGNGDPEYLSKYDYAMTSTMRVIHNLRARNARIICICHEDEVLDDTVIPAQKKPGPLVNKALVGPLYGMSSDVYRLVALLEPELNGEGNILARADDRVLYMRRNPAFMAKYATTRTRSTDVPHMLINPTLPAIYEILGTRPPFLTLYGHGGAGKTTLAVSEIILDAIPHETAKA